MISRELSIALRDAGLVWHPESGDRFQLDLPEQVEAEIEADVFTVSEMTIEARRYPTGTILAFNGTTEWALDSVAFADAVWLPREDQLRELLRATFRTLTRLEDSFEVEVDIAGERRRFDHPDVAEAYGMALLELIGRSK
ncbi:MAG TPA: pilus assembly protein CpaE [Agromyces sp.]|nr:pilus assembly protein CpaE [Agromyces sp.]